MQVLLERVNYSRLYRETTLMHESFADLLQHSERLSLQNEPHDYHIVFLETALAEICTLTKLNGSICLLHIEISCRGY